MMHIETQTERNAAVEFIGDMGACLGACNYSTRYIHEMVVKELKAAVLSYDRRQVVDCVYEPVACYVEVKFDTEGRVQSIEPFRRNRSKEGLLVAQCCLVYTNTYEKNTIPYKGSWDGWVEDFHRDEETGWGQLRDEIFGYEHNGCKDPSGYKFIKTSLYIFAPSGDGCEYLPDWFHFGCKTDSDLVEWVKSWDVEGYGQFDGCLFENVPVRLVLPKTPDAKPYTGSWDLAPWEDA